LDGPSKTSNEPLVVENVNREDRKKMRRAFITAAILAVFAVPAGATDCQNLTIEGGYITSRSGNVETVRTGLIGSYLNIQVGQVDPASQDERSAETFSAEVPSRAAGASVCPDGSVSFTLTEVAPDPEPVGEPTELLTETEVEELRPETRAVYVATHPGTGGVQEF
jgi:hypothetical protein